MPSIPAGPDVRARLVLAQTAQAPDVVRAAQLGHVQPRQGGRFQELLAGLRLPALLDVGVREARHGLGKGRVHLERLAVLLDRLVASTVELQ